jgi:hypothetical protein
LWLWVVRQFVRVVAAYQRIAGLGVATVHGIDQLNPKNQRLWRSFRPMQAWSVGF